MNEGLFTRKCMAVFPRQPKKKWQRGGRKAGFQSITKITKFQGQCFLSFFFVVFFLYDSEGLSSVVLSLGLI